MAPTLCWDCKKACTLGCEWAKNRKPVKGWFILQTKTGFTVRKCPEFERSSYGGGLYRDADQYIAVLEKTIQSLRENKR